MGQLRQRQQQREQHLLLDLTEHCKALLECWRGIWHKRSAVVRTAAARPRKFGIHLLSVPSGVNRSISEQLYGSPWVPNLGKCVPFHGDKEEEAQLDSRETQMEFDTISVTKRSCITHKKIFFKSL